MAQPFGRAIQATADLVRDAPERIPGALEKMKNVCIARFGAEEQQSGCNSDGDDMPDVDELSEGRDPNVAGRGQLCDGPEYGCGARVARGAEGFDWTALVIAGAAAATWVASARRSHKRR